MAWPPTLEELKSDMDVGAGDVRDDDQLRTVLDAAVSFVESVRPKFNYTEDPVSDLPDPTADLILGTIRLGIRWHTRRRSPDALIAMAEMGAARVPSIDPDIDRLLRIGRWAKAVVG